MTAIRVKTSANGGYPVHVNASGLAPLAKILEKSRPTKIALVTDRTVWRLHGQQLSRILSPVMGNPRPIFLPTGEKNKNISNIQRIYDGLLKRGCDRESVLAAFGGGIVGDLAGFAAASYYRGIRWVQLPTTLLAQVDSSVGGKTGYNLPEGKNLIGAFYPPVAVVSSVELLSTLPDRQVRAALGEVVKYAMIAGPGLLSFLDGKADAILKKDPATIARLVRSCVRIKADVVGQDEREKGLRRILNFGHTLGHAIETQAGYGRVLHGEAVACGMVLETRIGMSLGVTPPNVLPMLRKLLKKLNIADNIIENHLHTLIDRINYDKKIIGNAIPLYLPEDFGSVREVRVKRSQLVRVLKGLPN